MLTYFYCPDNVLITIPDCMHKCRYPGGRCMDIDSLSKAASPQAVISAINPINLPDVDLIKPLFMLYLEHTKNYGITPDTAAPSIEILAEPDELKPGTSKLTYPLTWGSYSIVKYLNNEAPADKLDITLLLNSARLRFNGPVNRLIVQFSCKDYGLAGALRQGINWHTRQFPVALMDDDEVFYTLFGKYFSLTAALRDKTPPPVCNKAENYGGRRCVHYCNVFRHCPYGSKLNGVILEG